MAHGDEEGKGIDGRKDERINHDEDDANFQLHTIWNLTSGWNSTLTLSIDLHRQLGTSSGSTIF